MTKHLVVIGAVAGGAAAAARARRVIPNIEELQITLIEKEDHVSPASCGIPYVLSGEIQNKDALNVVPETTFKNLFGVNVKTSTIATKVDSKAKVVICKNLISGEEEQYPYDTLILSPGSRCFIPPISGHDHSRLSTLKTLGDLDRTLSLMESSEDKRVVICGGGFIGLEAAHTLTEAGFKVSLIEFGPAVFSAMDPDMSKAVLGQLKMHGVDVHLRTKLTAVADGSTSNTVKVSLEDAEGKASAIEAGFVLMAAGMRPASELAKDAGCELSSTGHVVTNKDQSTTIESIYAVGDVTQTFSRVTDKAALLALANPASRQGRVAAFNACVEMGLFDAEKKEFGGVVGTSICPVFDVTVACTGLNTAALKREGIEYNTLYCSFYSHVRYYKGETAAPIVTKIFTEKQTGRLIGAQGFSPNGEALARRMDVLATYIQMHGTYEDMGNNESCYNPWYGNPRDVVQFAGFASENVQDGLENYIYPEQFLRDEYKDAVIIDVRNPDERDNMFELSVPHYFFPLPTVLVETKKLLESGEISKDTPVVCMCASGARSHTAQRVLLGLGLDTRNLCGGISGLVRVRPELVIKKM